MSTLARKTVGTHVKIIDKRHNFQMDTGGKCGESSTQATRYAGDDKTEIENTSKSPNYQESHQQEDVPHKRPRLIDPDPVTGELVVWEKEPPDNEDRRDKVEEAKPSLISSGKGGEEMGSEAIKDSRKKVEVDEAGDPPLGWSPAVSRALQERYGHGRKRTPRTLTRLMQQHRESERHRHHGLNASIKEISQRIPGFDVDHRETKIVKLQRIINYICHLEKNVKKLCDESGVTLDYKHLFLSPHICKNADEWKCISKATHHQPIQDTHHKTSPPYLKPHLEKKNEWAEKSHNSNVTHPSKSNTKNKVKSRKPSSVVKPPDKDLVLSLLSSYTPILPAPPPPDLPVPLPVLPAPPPPHLSPDQASALPSEFPLVKLQEPEEPLEDLTWLDHMILPDLNLDHMCTHVYDLPDLLPDVLNDLAHPTQGFSFDEFAIKTESESPEQNYTDISMMHSYVKTPSSTPSNKEFRPTVDEDLSCLPCAKQLSTTQAPSDDQHQHYQSQAEKPSSTNLSHPFSQLLIDSSLEMTTRSPVKQEKMENASHRWIGSGQKAAADKKNRPKPSAEKSVTSKGKVDYRKISWMNGFMMYSRIHRKEYRAENPGAHASIISRLMGQAWRKLDPDMQQTYRDKAKIYINDYLLPQSDEQPM